MADLKISLLPTSGALNLSDLFAVVNAGVTSKITYSGLLSELNADLTTKTLAQTLASGNVTGGTDIILSTNDYLTNPSGNSRLDLGGASNFFYYTNDAGVGADAQIYVDNTQASIGNSFGDLNIVSGATTLSNSHGLFKAMSAGVTSSVRGIQINASILYNYHATEIQFDSAKVSLTIDTLTFASSKTLRVSDSTTIGTNSITFAGGEVITFTAANALTLTTTGATNVTLPTSGTLLANTNNLSDLSSLITARKNLAPEIYMVSGNQATTNGTATDITELVTESFEANKRYYFTGTITVGCNNTGGVKLAISLPVGASMQFNLFTRTTGPTAALIQSSISPGTLNATAFCTQNVANIQVQVSGEFELGASAGPAQFQFAAGTAGQTATIYQLGTLIKYWKIDV